MTVKTCSTGRESHPGGQGHGPIFFVRNGAFILEQSLWRKNVGRGPATIINSTGNNIFFKSSYVFTVESRLAWIVI